MSYLLSAAMSRGWTGTFEMQLARTLSVIVVRSLQTIKERIPEDVLTYQLSTQILESFHNPRIVLDSRLWDTAEAKGSPGPSAAQYRSQILEPCNLARISSLLRDPQVQIAEVQSVYQSTRDECDKMESILSQIPMIRNAGGILITDMVLAAKRIHVRQQTGHGILLMIALTLNGILQTHKSCDSEGARLDLEADKMVDQVIGLAEQAMQYRPLAASATPMCLIVAWAVTNDALKQEKLQRLLDAYQEDFTSVRWQEQAIRVKARLRGPPHSLASAEPISITIT